MPYSQFTLDQLIDQMGELLDDTSFAYFTRPEITFALYEGLTVFGSLCSYWRQRGVFNIDPTDPSPFYDLSQQLPALRPRTTTLDTVVKIIQYRLLESPTGIAGTDGSGQVSILSILQAVARARNRFCLDVHFPNNVHPNYAPVAPPDGLVSFPQSSVYVHRASWKDSGGQWANLWRQDDWVFDHSPGDWPTNVGFPEAYSEAELAPLQLQIYPNPANAGTLEAVTVDSVDIDITDLNSLMQLPNEWVYAVTWAAIEDLMTGGGQIIDALRGEYASQRYKQAVEFAKDARSVIRLTLNGNPLDIDTLAAIDAGNPYWRNQVGRPQMAGILYDIVAINPGIMDQQYAIGADLVVPAPLPTGGEFVQIGEESLEDILDYASHVLMFKCGGKEFQDTFGMYDNFMQAVSQRKGVNAAKIKYFQPLFGAWQREQVQRPDAVAVKG